MRIYLDVSCLNRPFDDQNQLRVRLESEAVLLVIARCDSGEWEQCVSDAVVREIDATPDIAHREEMHRLLPDEPDLLKLTDAVYQRATVFERQGVIGMDGIHLAACEAIRADVFVTCDDQLLRWCRRNAHQLTFRVVNPTELIVES